MQAGRQAGMQASRLSPDISSSKPPLLHPVHLLASVPILLHTCPSPCPTSSRPLLPPGPPPACLRINVPGFIRGVNENVELSQVSVLAIPKTYNCHTFQVLISKKRRTVEIVTSKRVAGANVMISFLAFPMGKRQSVTLNSRLKNIIKNFFIPANQRYDLWFSYRKAKKSNRNVAPCQRVQRYDFDSFAFLRVRIAKVYNCRQFQCWIR